MVFEEWRKLENLEKSLKGHERSNKQLNSHINLFSCGNKTKTRLEIRERSNCSANP
jgi:hypothetical protein